jgi:hypothetical protein
MEFIEHDLSNRTLCTRARLDQVHRQVLVHGDLRGANFIKPDRTMMVNFDWGVKMAFPSRLLNKELREDMTLTGSSRLAPQAPAAAGPTVVFLCV